MIGPAWYASDPLVHAVGMALVHGIWQGAVLAGLAAIALRVTDPMASGRRHAILCGALAFQLAVFVMTVVAVYREAVPAPLLASDPAAWRTAFEGAGGDPSGEASRVLGGILPRIRPLLPWILAAWAGGVALFAARLAGGMARAASMRESAIPASPDIERRARALAVRIGLRRPFRVLAADGVDTPLVIGWRRPAILLPRLLPVRSTAAGLDTLLLHELAHLKRWDDRLAILQSVLQCLFFHHPASRWLVARLTCEREHRCDDLVASQSRDPAPYIRALLGLEEWRAQRAGFALHADAGSLLERVRRLVEPRGRISHPRLAMGLLSGVVIGAAAAWVQLRVVPALPATPPGWTTIQASDDAGTFTVVQEAGRVRAVAIDGVPLPADRFTHVGDSLRVLGAAGNPVFAARVRPEGGLDWQSRPPDWRLEGS